MEGASTGGPPARQILQTRRSRILREANRKRYGLYLDLNGGNNGV